MVKKTSLFSWRRALLVMILLLSPGCASQGVAFINPQNGATLECSGAGFGLGSAWVKGHIDECARRSEARGYVAVDRLTPQQRLDLEKRGLLPTP